MFLFRASRYLEELGSHRPDILAACQKAMATTTDDRDFLRVDNEAFGACPSESIDYAVMENTDRAVVVPLDVGWDDIGAWSALWDTAQKDEHGNAVVGDPGNVLLESSRDNYIRPHNRIVATVGVDELVIVDTADAVLVAARDRVQDVKAIVNRLNQLGRPETELHREVYRPWGKYDSIDAGDRFQVKRITVNPGGQAVGPDAPPPVRALGRGVGHRARGARRGDAGADRERVGLPAGRLRPLAREPRQDPAGADRGPDRVLPRRGRHRPARGPVRAAEPAPEEKP